MILRNTVCLVVTMRSGSKRLPKKCLKEICGKNSIDFFNHLFQQVKNAMPLLVYPVVAIPEYEKREFVEQFKSRGMQIYRGDEFNVAKRVLDCAKDNFCEYILDITGDCPFVALYDVLRIVAVHRIDIESGKQFYCSNVFPKRYVPDGHDIQLYSRDLLEDVISSGNYIQEHSGWNVYNALKGDKRVCTGYVPIHESFEDFSGIRITLDTRKDLKALKKVYPLYKECNGLSCESGVHKFYEMISRPPKKWWPNRNVVAKEIGIGGGG